jgi:DNA-binding PadR family transcriptional regulator
MRAAESHRSGSLSPEMAVLGIFLDGPSHGYDLHQRFVADLGQVWHLSQSQAYAVLKRLEQRGDVLARGRLKGKASVRQMLSISPGGRRHFLRWLEQGCGTNARSIRLELLTRLYFAQRHRPASSQQILVRQLDEIDRNLDHLRLSLGAEEGPEEYNRLSLDLRLRQMELIRSWVMEIGRRFHLSVEGTA